MPVALLALVGCAKGQSKETSQKTSTQSTPSQPSTPSTPSTPSQPDVSEGGESVTPETSESQTTANVVEVYLKKGSQKIDWWLGGGANVYAYTWDGINDPATADVDETTNHRWFEPSFIEAYDENQTLYYEISVGEQVPEHVLFLRCDPAVVASLPTEWPSEGIWNQTVDGNIAQKTQGEGSEQTPVPGRYWVDLTIQ